MADSDSGSGTQLKERQWNTQLKSLFQSKYFTIFKKINQKLQSIEEGNLTIQESKWNRTSFVFRNFVNPKTSEWSHSNFYEDSDLYDYRIFPICAVKTMSKSHINIIDHFNHSAVQKLCWWKFWIYSKLKPMFWFYCI